MYFCSICERIYEDIEVATKCCLDKLEEDENIYKGEREWKQLN